MKLGLEGVIPFGRPKHKDFCDRCGKRQVHIYRCAERIVKGDYCSVHCVQAARLELIAKKAGEVS